MTITGSNFTNAYYVAFGGTGATSWSINSDTSITAVSPPHATGTVVPGTVLPPPHVRGDRQTTQVPAFRLGAGAVLLAVLISASTGRPDDRVAGRACLPTGHGATWALAFSADGRLLASANTEGSIKLWDWRARRLERTIAARDPRALLFSPDSRTLTIANGGRWGSGTPTSLGTYDVHRKTASLPNIPQGRTELHAF